MMNSSSIPTSTMLWIFCGVLVLEILFSSFPGMPLGKPIAFIGATIFAVAAIIIRPKNR